MYYDPESPTMFLYFKYVRVNDAVRRFVLTDHRISEFFLGFNDHNIGRISVLCGKIICQSAIVNGVLAIYSPGNYYMGHLVVQGSVAETVIPASNRVSIDSLFFKR